ncbi:MAG: hypothetical protein HY840_13675 [Bacteroidetes bacterium]|nr:hypothetical protein [Bacteroidota bacterium]
MLHIIAKLGLRSISDAGLGDYAQDKIDKINAAPAFAAVDPSTATLQTKTDEYESALVKSDNGTVADTALKDQRRAELENLLTIQAQNCAVIANGDLPLYLTTGYGARDTKGSPTGHLPAVTGLNLFYGNSPAELEASWDVMEDAQNFTVQVYTDIANPDGSKIKEYMKPKIGKKKTTLDGLPSGQMVFVRVRANGGSTGFGPWSDVAEKRVP